MIIVWWLWSLQVVDPNTGRTLPVGQDGEVCFWGPHVMKGYWKKPDATAATIDKDGWLHSGKSANKPMIDQHE